MPRWESLRVSGNMESVISLVESECLPHTFHEMVNSRVTFFILCTFEFLEFYSKLIFASLKQNWMFFFPFCLRNLRIKRQGFIAVFIEWAVQAQLPITTRKVGNAWFRCVFKTQAGNSLVLEMTGQSGALFIIDMTAD